MQKSTRAKSAKTGIVSVAKTWAYVWILLTFILMGFQAAAHGLADKLIGVNKEMIDIVISVLTKTIPLSVSVILISIAFFREWFSGLAMFFYCFFVITICTLVLAPDGLEIVIGGVENPQGNVFTSTIVHIGKNYFEVYEWRYFASSLVLGIFLGWIWAFKILPGIKRQ